MLANLGMMLLNPARARALREVLTALNAARWWVVAGALVLMAVVLYVPAVRDMFRFAQMHGLDLAVCVAAALGGVLGFELLLRRL